MGSITISLAQLQGFFLIFLRVGAILWSLPLLGERHVPHLVKAGLALALVLVLRPLLDLPAAPFTDGVWVFGLGVAGELLLGVIIGFAVRLLFAGIQFAGHVVGFQMGMALSNVLDPLTQSQNSIPAQFNNLIAVLLLLAINAHHWFIRAVVESFKLVPPFQFHWNEALTGRLVFLSGQLFIIAVKVGAPLIVAMLLTSVVLGLVARTVPQMNVFIVAMPLKIIVGLLFLGLALPYMVAYTAELLGGLGGEILRLLALMR